jgi:hypothetical protein
MKPTKIFKSFEDLSENPNAWMAAPERPGASPAQFWNEANASQEDSFPPEELTTVRPVRGWGINE